jgi:hypothetical protein
MSEQRPPGSRREAPPGESAVTVVQEARPPFIPEGAEVMTVIIEFHPGRPWHAAAPAPGTGVRLHAGRRDAI